MKNHFFFSTMCVCIIFLVFACSLDDELNSNQETFATVDGLTFRLKEGVPQDALTVDPQSLIDDLQVTSRERYGFSDIPITLEELDSIVKSITKNKYPNFSEETMDQDMNIIKDDFLNISDNIIQENIEKIASIYGNQLRYEVYLMCKNKIINRTIYRSSDSLPELTDGEIEMLLKYPWNAPGYATASAGATLEAIYYYGGNGNNKKSNAFTHSVWCNKICYLCPGRNPLGTRDSRVSYARSMTTRHEEKDSGESKVMDLHNNDIGITYFENYCTMVRALPFMPRTIPSKYFPEKATNWCKDRADNAYYCPTPSQMDTLTKILLKLAMVLIYRVN